MISVPMYSYRLMVKTPANSENKKKTLPGESHWEAKVLVQVIEVYQGTA